MILVEKVNNLKPFERNSKMKKLNANEKKMLESYKGKTISVVLMGHSMGITSLGGLEDLVILKVTDDLQKNVKSLLTEYKLSVDETNAQTFPWLSEFKVKREALDVVMSKGVIIASTSLAGYLPAETTYQDLVKVFGPTNVDTYEYDKIDAEWNGRINGKVFAIYNYKTGKNYCSTNPDVEDITGECAWHIGVENKKVANLILAYFSERK